MAAKVLMVCMGNICRSPLAEGLLRQRAAERGLAVQVDSAGTQAYHVGEAPDSRAIAVARRHGFDIGALRARQVAASDFAQFDHILLADRVNQAALMRRFGRLAEGAELLLEFAGISPESEVPDPYYGDERDFESVLALLDRATSGILRRLG